MRKFVSILLASTLSIAFFTGCGSTNDHISIVSREDGSGTRGAFIELFSILNKNADGTKKDMTSKEAIIAKATDIMMTNVNGDKNSIGYISLGSLNDSIKALNIDSVPATVENVKNNSYKISRPFIIATKGESSEVTKDFINFILSKDGQSVVSKNYIAINDKAEAYNGDKPNGKVVVAGSSSVNPVMEKLKEAYEEINPNASVEIQATDSSSGITATIDGTCDIGMSSRELKDNEKAKLKDTTIALDGIAVIVNNDNTHSNLTTQQIKSIFTGEITKWSEVQK